MKQKWLFMSNEKRREKERTFGCGVVGRGTREEDDSGCCIWKDYECLCVLLIVLAAEAKSQKQTVKKGSSKIYMFSPMLFF